MKNVNHRAVILSALLVMGLGFLWYGPLFGDKWMAFVGLDEAILEIKPPGAATWITTIVATVLSIYGLAWFFQQLDVDSGANGAGMGLLIGFAFILLAKLRSNAFAMNPYGLSWISGGFDMVALAISGFVLGWWRKKQKKGQSPF